MRRASRKACGAQSRRALRDCRSKIPPATARRRSIRSMSRSSGCAPRGARSMLRVAIRCSSAARKVFSSAVPMSPRRSRRLKAYATRAPIASMRPASAIVEQIKAVVDAVAPKPVNVLIGWGSDLPSTSSRSSAYGASASEAHSREARGAASCAPRRPLPSRAASTASATRHRAPSSTSCSACS